MAGQGIHITAGTGADGANFNDTSGGSFGIGQISAPSGSVIGVFLGDFVNTATSPPSVDYTGAGRDVQELMPLLQQPFYVGAGTTLSAQSRVIIVPAGATRLFLGTTGYAVAGFNGTVSATAIIASGQVGLTVSTSTLSFAAAGSQTVALGSSGANFTFSASATVASGGNWLSVTPTVGNTPATLTVTVTPSSLPPGTYTGLITIAAPSASNNPQTVKVALTIAPTVSNSPQSLGVLNFRLAAAGGGGVSANQVFSVSNDNQGTATVQVSPISAPWITVSPSTFALASGAQSQPVSVQINRDALPPATSYISGVVGITGLISPAQLQVNVALEDQPGLPLLSRSALAFTVDASQPYSDFSNLKQIVTIINDGPKPVNLLQVTSSEALVTPSWTVTPGGIPLSGTQPVSVTISNTNLISGGGNGPNGTYQAMLSFVFDDGSLDELLVTVDVQQGSTAQELLLDQTGLIFPAAAPQSVLASNYTSQNYTLSVTAPQAAWIHLSPTTQILKGDGGQASFGVSVDSSAPLDSAGVARGFITVAYLNGTTQTFSQQIEVLFLGTALVGSSSNTSGLVQRAGVASGCIPGSLDSVFSLLSEGATVPIGQPAQVDVKISDNCGNAITSGAARVSFSNGDPPVALLPVGGGSWQGTWQPESGSNAILSVASVSGGLTGSATRSVQIASGGLKLPYVPTGSVLNAASLEPFVDRIAPGTIISIFGAQLASTTVSAAFPLPMTLASTQVQLGSTALPLLYVSPTQINAIVPSGVPLSSNASLVVATSGFQSIPIPIILLPTDPGIFSGAVVSANGTAIGPSAPAHLGDTLVIYCTGLGAVNESLDPTLPAPTDHTVRTQTPVSVFLRGMDGSWISSYVSFAGLAPGYSGLYQVNVQVPGNTATGDQVSLYVAAGTMQSNQVVISVR